MKSAPSQHRLTSQREKSLVSTNQLLILSLLLIVPSLALIKQSEHLDFRILLAIPVLISIISYLLCYSDKQKAKRGSRRTPESTLHLFEILGGWPGSFVAQKQFRHKTSKRNYQFTFWMIICIYQIASFDSLQDWLWARYLGHVINSIQA